MPEHTHERVWTGAFLQSMTTVYTAGIDAVTGRPGVEVSIFLRPDSDNYYYFWRERPGKTYRYRSTGTANQEQARHIAIQKYFEWVGGLEARRKSVEPTIRQLEAEWEHWIEARETTKETKRRHLGISRLHIVPFFGDRRISSLTQKDLDGYRRARLNDPSPPKISTIRQEAIVLSLWSLFGVEQGYLSRGDRLSVTIQIPQTEVTDSSWFTLAELRTLYRVLRRADPYVFEICRLAYYLGCRPVELYNLKHTDYWNWDYPVRGMRFDTVQVRLWGKKHHRVVIAPPVVKTILRNLKNLTNSEKVVVDQEQFQQVFRDTLILHGMYKDQEGRRRTVASFRPTKVTVDLRHHKTDRNVLAAFQGHTPEQQSRCYNRIFEMLEQEGMHVRRLGVM